MTPLTVRICLLLWDSKKPDAMSYVNMGLSESLAFSVPYLPLIFWGAADSLNCGTNIAFQAALWNNLLTR